MGGFFAGKGGCGVRVLELVGGKLCEDLRRVWTGLAEGVRWRIVEGAIGEKDWRGFGGIGVGRGGVWRGRKRGVWVG